MSKTLSRFLPYIIIAALLFPLLAHVYLGQYNRAVSDDFCFTLRAEEHGVIGAVDWWYHNWSAYYSAIVGQGMIGTARAWRFVPSVLIVLWIIAAVWTAYQFAAVFHVQRRWFSAWMLGLAFVFGVVDGTANVFQSFYWTSGAVTYTLPMIVLTFNTGVILFTLRQEHFSIPAAALMAGLTMLAAGFSPLFAVFQLAVFSLAAVITYLFVPVRFKRSLLILCGTGVLFTVIALLIMLLAPGNAIRRAQLAPPMSVTQLLWFTPYATFGFLATSAGYLSPLALLLPLMLGGLVGFAYQPLENTQRLLFFRRRYRFLLMIAGFGVLLIMSVFFVGAYALSDLPPASAYPIPQAAYVVMVIGLGYVMGMSLQKDYAGKSNPFLANLASGLIVLLLIFGPVRAAITTFAHDSAFRTFASDWDARDARLTEAAAAGEEQVILTAFKENLADYAGLKPTKGEYPCIAELYGLQSVEVAQDE